MINAVDAEIESDVIVGDGSAGTVEGLMETASVSTATYADTTPTAEYWAAQERLTQTVESDGDTGRPVVLMHPRRLSWLRQRAVVEPVVGLDWSAPTAPGAATALFGGSVKVIADAAIPTTLGTGTNEDRVIVMRAGHRPPVGHRPHRTTP
jgi:hypothetical protein